MDMAGLNVPVFGKLPQWTCYETAEVMADVSPSLSQDDIAKMAAETIDGQGGVSYITPISLAVEMSSAVLETSNLAMSFLRYQRMVSELSDRASAIWGAV